MLITADQLLCHAIGDYVLQSDWMARQKSKSWSVAAFHGLAYCIPFIIAGATPLQTLVMASTHAVIDRLRLARYVVWAKNWISPKHNIKMIGAKDMYYTRSPSWEACKDFGVPLAATDRYLAHWLLIIVDNVMHVLINGAALKWL